MKISKLFPIMSLVAAGLVVGSPGAQAATSPPPSLAGEVFLSPQGALAPASFVCEGNGVGDSGSFTYHVTGTATGPYPGTFVEDITINAGPIPIPPDNTSTLTSFHSTFTITSAAGTVTGTKDLTVGGGGTAWCVESFFAAFDAPTLTYSAAINTGGASYKDSGTASARNASLPNNGTAIFDQTFSENFVTSTGVVPIAPTSVDQCKNGGWKNYPQFKNQGECVAYVQRPKK